MSFSIISQFLFFFGGCPKFPFFDNLAQKARTPKHYKIGVSAKHFLKNRCASRNGHFGEKNQIQKFQLSILFASFFFNNKKLKFC